MPAAVIAERLRRPPEQVRRRCRVLLGAGRAGRAYHAAEDDAIADCWANGGDVEALAHALGRTAGSVRLRAQKLGLHRPPSRTRWRAYEDAAVRDGYEHGLTCAQIAAELPERTPPAVAARAAKLGLATYARAWTPNDETIVSCAGSCTIPTGCWSSTTAARSLNAGCRRSTTPASRIHR